jgi:hypothetical protein
MQGDGQLRPGRKQDKALIPPHTRVELDLAKVFPDENSVNTALRTSVQADKESSVRRR